MFSQHVAKTFFNVWENIKFLKAGRLIITGVKGIDEPKTLKNKNMVPQQNLKA